jgi:hypothetical protein
MWVQTVLLAIGGYLLKRITPSFISALVALH